MFVAYNKKKVITAVSATPFVITGNIVEQVENNAPKEEWHKFIGTKFGGVKQKDIKELKVAAICNWNDFCGISTYSKFLINAIKPKVKELKVFSEIVPQLSGPDEDFVVRCWERGKSMMPALDQILEWKPDFIIIQHEFGIFPKATYFLQMLQAFDDIPHVITTHSVYEHLDKSVCTSAIKNIVVHSEDGKQTLRRTGNNSNIFVIPHGCVQFVESAKQELWNIFHTPYALIQFGFGFFYKGVDKVLDALHHLKKTNPKYKDIFYVYLCSDNVHTSNIHNKYYEFLLDKISELDLHDNAVIIKKFQTEQTINNYLRTAKVALFPYVSDPKNTVYGASGAIRIAMANGIPVIASNCHQFDDLEGVIPRPGDYLSLAKEIDNVFTKPGYKTQLLANINKYIEENTWDISADRYLNLYSQVI